MFVEHRLCIKRDMALGPMKNMESINYAPIPKGRIVNLADGETSAWKHVECSNYSGETWQVMEIKRTQEKPKWYDGPLR